MNSNEKAFDDKLFDVLRNFMEYGNYQKKQENAIKVLLKAFPHKSMEELTKLFNSCCKAYNDAVILVKNNLAQYSTSDAAGIRQAEKDFRKNHESIGEQMLNWIIGWVYHWYHER